MGSPCKVADMWEYTGLRAVIREKIDYLYFFEKTSPKASNLFISLDVLRKYHRKVNKIGNTRATMMIM